MQMPTKGIMQMQKFRSKVSNNIQANPTNNANTSCVIKNAPSLEDKRERVQILITKGS